MLNLRSVVLATTVASACLLTGTVTSPTVAVGQSTLPPCPNDQSAFWHNCQGTFTSPDGEKYVGEFKDNKKNGQGTFTSPNGIKYVGEVKDDKINGQGTITSPNGEKYVGEFKDNKKNGQGTLTSPDGTKYVGQFKDGKLNGQGTYTWPNGDKYVGEFTDGSRTGTGTYTWPNGDKYVGEFKDGKLSGQGTLTSPDGTKYVGQFKDDKKNGQVTVFFPDGTKYVGEFKDNKRIGGDYSSLRKFLDTSLHYTKLEDSPLKRMGVRAMDLEVQKETDGKITSWEEYLELWKAGTSAIKRATKPDSTDRVVWLCGDTVKDGLCDNPPAPSTGFMNVNSDGAIVMDDIPCTLFYKYFVPGSMTWDGRVTSYGGPVYIVYSFFVVARDNINIQDISGEIVVYFTPKDDSIWKPAPRGVEGYGWHDDAENKAVDRRFARFSVGLADGTIKRHDARVSNELVLEIPPQYTRNEVIDFLKELTDTCYVPPPPPPPPSPGETRVTLPPQEPGEDIHEYIRRIAPLMQQKTR